MATCHVPLLSLMEKRDARSLTPKTWEEIRRKAIRLLKMGLKTQQVADQLEVGRKSDQARKMAHKEGGMEALKAKKQGRPRGSGLVLSEEQQLMIRIFICDITPGQLKMTFALWGTRSDPVAHQGTIQNRYGEKADRPLSEALGLHPPAPGQACFRAQRQSRAEADGRRVSGHREGGGGRRRGALGEETGIKATITGGAGSHTEREGPGVAPQGKGEEREHDLYGHKLREAALHDLRRKLQHSGLYQVPHQAVEIFSEESPPDRGQPQGSPREGTGDEVFRVMME